ncbi:cation diffusion facilitator family transporter [Aestuariibacter halophilus]|uniref:Cation diffusion facilitator family transporter n=1 Tax=Fluctibacter halophilus TaxID=226011 RepID=A0ABS8G8X3_9ALTE|nr:cation diffusion facilitator family transporter [Aestuariibacter halophilus]MCC2616973.1 cation diffusion facilitator family transporter [Aestuariibacter halophilus]
MHHHHHHHHHHHETASQRIGWAFFLNVTFTIIEFIGGWLTNSTAIMADAVHDLGDSLSIGTAWLLQTISGKQATAQFTYGYRRFALLGALVNSVILLVGSLWVISEAIPRLADPQMPVTEGMALLAVFGIAVNGYAAFKLSAGKSLNERVLNWHLLEDVLGWVAVLIVSITLMFVDLPILDPLLSIAFTVFILVNVVRTLRDTVQLFLQATPDRDDRLRIRGALTALDGIEDVHHLHFWSLDGEHHVLTAHLVLVEGCDLDQVSLIKQRVSEVLAPYDLAHTTIELEFHHESCRDQGH